MSNEPETTNLNNSGDEQSLDIEVPEKQRKSRVESILKWQWKKGQSGNPKGRPKGKTMKEYARELLACQTEDERQEFLNGLSKDTIWKMAEGNPDISANTKGEFIIKVEPEIAEKYGINSSTINNSEGQAQV